MADLAKLERQYQRRRKTKDGRIADLERLLEHRHQAMVYFARRAEALEALDEGHVEQNHYASKLPPVAVRFITHLSRISRRWCSDVGSISRRAGSTAGGRT